MEIYNWQKKEWPHFTYSENIVDNELLAFAEKSGKVSGMLRAFSDQNRNDAIVDIIVSEAIKTSEIEGEFLNRMDLISSVRKNLGLTPVFNVRDKRALGISALLSEVRNTFSEPLSENMLLNWHSLLLNYRKDINTGVWRTHSEPMQIISGAIGKIEVHFEAPSAVMVPEEMKRFTRWFNETSPGGNQEIKKGPIRSAIAHLYFESIHPFEDGNGRIGRAVAEKALSQNMGQPVLLSLSRAIEKNKKKYYNELKNAQRTLDITSWIVYFVKTLLIAQTDAENEIDFTLQKVKYFDRFGKQFNERQLKVANRMFEEGSTGFKGGMNAKKYSGIAKVSKATATRDLQYLTGIGAFLPAGKGRSTSYMINISPGGFQFTC